MPKEQKRLQNWALAAVLLAAGAWFLHKPFVSVLWLVDTGELPAFTLKRAQFYVWFETFVPPWSIEGCKSWLGYALFAIFGLILWTFAFGVLTEAAIVTRALQILHYSIYALFAAVAVLVLFEARIL